ncbi:MAG: class I fructose-bisphosphate aldolase [Alphaproteobacteria bacterium]
MTGLPIPVRNILAHYESDHPGTKANLARLLMHGALGGTGRLLILPVDQGFEHGPARSFSMNPRGYDPHSHFELAIEARLSAFAAPLGLLEAGASTFAGQIPLILKVNSAHCLVPGGTGPDQAVTASVKDALRLGCSAIGFTLYPGSDQMNAMVGTFRALAEEAKAHGLAVVAWAYPRGNLSKKGETALDVVAYGAHMAALLGAHVIKVKLPSAHLEIEAARQVYEQQKVPLASLTERVRHVVDCCFQGKRLVVFSGGEAKDLTNLYEEARAIHQGGGNGSIIGRNAFQRPKKEALEMLTKLIEIYADKP